MISGTVNSKGVQARLSKAVQHITPAINSALEQGMDMVIAEIRSNDNRLFRNPSAGLTGELARGKASGRKIKAYWTGKSAKYGYVLERGPKSKRSWEIGPSGTLGKGYTGSKGGVPGAGKRHNAGDPVSALRFKGKDGITYRRKVVINWTPASLRPHWSWAWGRKVDAIKALIRQRVSEAINNGG